MMKNIYYDLKETTYNNIDLFSQKERFTLFGKLKSYCVGKSTKKENRKFAMEEFELNVKTLELGCYKDSPGDNFHFVTFRNIVFAAIDCNEFEWLENFINKYSSEIQKDQITNMRYYSFARLEFARKNYEKALDNLIKVKYEFFLFKVDVKDLMFKIYFEMGLYENAISVLNTMRQYIEHTNDLSGSFKTGYRNFIKFGNDLLKIKSSGSRKDEGLLEKNIKNENNLFSRQWLLEKIGAN